jgi:6-phosphogluconolactonase (cycloisomerase 2 family)
MRMKLNKSSQLVLVTAASLLVAGMLTACETLTVDFVFAASSKAAGSNNYGEIDVFEINSESGHMRPIPASPFPSGGRDPVAEAVSADNANLFVVNQDDNNIVQFVIGNDGKLYPYNTVNTAGVYPLAIAANKSNLFVVDTYQPLPSCSTAAPCAGSIEVFPLSTATSTVPVTIGSPAVNASLSSNYWPLSLTGSKSNDVVVPTSVNVLASGTYVYVSAYDSSVTPTVGYVFGFTVGSGGVLTPLSGSPFTAGVQPSAVASDSTGKYLYVTDFKNNNILGYTIASTTGLLTTLGGSPYPAGDSPSAIIVDPTYSYAYVTNSEDATVSGYSMSNGVLTRLGTYTTGLQPVAIGIDPSTNHFLFTANYLGDNISDFELSPTAGTLLEAQDSPFVSNDWVTALAAIPHNGTGGGIQTQ